MTLNEMKCGDKKIIISINNDLSIKQRLLEIGFNNGEIIECVLINIFKNLKAFKIKDSVISLRSYDCKKIKVGDLYE